jgi:bis(5'-nucleosidyl)-tetraphosphatase/histidine triad (HIT) family protein
MSDPECVFCREIVQKRNAEIVYEDNYTMAFLDYAPVDEGHLLVIPKRHFVDILDIDPEDFLKVQRIVKDLCKPLKDAMNADAINVGQNNGPCANQIVMHYHVHIIPRWCHSNLNWDRKPASAEDLKETASKIRAELRRVNILK